MTHRIFVLILLAAAGCSGKSESRLRLSGEAVCDGQPIVFGDVVLTPDGAKGNSGPQGFAQIRNGRYDTTASGGKGYAGGPTVLRVTGFTAEGGKLICEHEYKADMPTGDSEFKIEVPPLAGKPKATKEI
ncbi:hypothetical protein BH11PLA2_BH11PLA2_34090 [soil metagenome]